MSYLTANMKMITECADHLARLGEKLFNEAEMKTFKIGQTTEFSCPDGYEFHDENGNVIEAKKIVLEKKSELPRTYDDCVIYNREGSSYNRAIRLSRLEKLLICRDAYWKLARWKPDWSNSSQEKFTIRMYDGYRHFGHDKYLHSILAFPTEEMRNAFYENFKELIEQCKELI